jgi:transcriptional regulator with XRE-family HTH domain
MYGNPQRRSASDVQDLRRDGGKWLRELREAAGLSQRELAVRVNQDYYTFISQLETGRGRVPPDRYRDWAKALNVPVREFVTELMRFYDPITFDILFGDDENETDLSFTQSPAET